MREAEFVGFAFAEMTDALPDAVGIIRREVRRVGGKMVIWPAMARYGSAVAPIRMQHRIGKRRTDE